VEKSVGEAGLKVLLNNGAMFPPYFANEVISRQMLMVYVNINTVGVAITCQVLI
ncbi:hypothetical protein Angca_000479, partial [Angiostrongylus cantonensis]